MPTNSEDEKIEGEAFIVMETMVRNKRKLKLNHPVPSYYNNLLYQFIPSKAFFNHSILSSTLPHTIPSISVENGIAIISVKTFKISPCVASHYRKFSLQSGEFHRNV